VIASKPQQDIAFHAFRGMDFTELLGLAPAIGLSSDPFRQLRYLQSYLAKIGCGSVAVEAHYIDRDHMEDHSVFYSRNLYPYANSCRRLHFFRGDDPDETKRAILALLSKNHRNRDEFRLRCRQFSNARYLGFSVIKPLSGSPVGRTVLIPFPESDGTAKRLFPCTREYRGHFCGVELTVRGLAFQQQDVGVSACATTALWSALSKVRDLEEIGAATPVQITGLASRYNLMHGRAMPSEGLSLDQMCQAVQAIGVSPDLIKVYDQLLPDQKFAAVARGCLHAATTS
jgi:hypothetical protein